MKNNIVGEITQVLNFTLNLINNLDEHIDIFHKMYPQDLEKKQLQDKLIAETTLLLFLVNRIPITYGFSPIILQIANKLEKYARHPEHLLILSSNPQAVIGVGLSHIMLDKLGMPNTIFDDVINTAFSSKFVTSIDRPNFRQMEMLWLQGIFQNIQPDFSELLSCSIIKKPLHPIYMRREDAYAITHTAMYLTNFGEKNLNEFIDINFIQSFIDHSISWCLVYADWDLLIEILMVSLFIKSNNSKKSHFSLISNSILEKIFSNNGVIPSLNFSNVIYNNLQGRKKEAYFAMQSYHTTYVYGILRTLEFCSKNNTLELDVEEDSNIDLNIANYIDNNLSYDNLVKFILTGNLNNIEVLINAKLIYLARECKNEELFDNLETYETSSVNRVVETCEVAAEKLIQFIRATSYKQKMLEIDKLNLNILN